MGRNVRNDPHDWNRPTEFDMPSGLDRQPAVEFCTAALTVILSQTRREERAMVRQREADETSKMLFSIW